jgi:Transposase DDE domain
MIRHELDDFCTWTYVIVSDLYRELAPDRERPGPRAVCSDAELLTLALVGECCGWHQETELLSRWQSLRHLFPCRPERTRFNRRRRALAHVMNLLRQAILQILDLAHDPQCIIDSLPVPVVQFYHAPQAALDWKQHGASFGKCVTKKQTIYGYKLHLLITLGGVIRDFELAPANEADVTIAAELLPTHQHLTVLGDKAYISAPLAQALATDRQIQLLTLPRSNQRVQVPTPYATFFNGVRQIIETVNSQLAQQFAIEVTSAHSFAGLVARLYTKLTAHTLCFYLNRLLGTSDCLQIKSLAFPI